MSELEDAGEQGGVPDDSGVQSWASWGGGGWRCFALTFSEEAGRKAHFDGKIIRWFPTMSV